MADALSNVISFVHNHYDRFRCVSGKREPFEFLIVGSYPAHLKMVEHRLLNPIKYNDIDIMHKDIQFAKYMAGLDFRSSKKTRKGKHEQFLAIQYQQFREGMEINYVCLNDDDTFTKRIDEADINGVAVGIIVRLACNGAVLESSWIQSPHFQTFLMTQKLAPVFFTGLQKPRNALTTLVRLLSKAHQSNLRYSLPSIQEICQMCHGRAISLETQAKYGSLPQSLKSVIDSVLFAVQEVDKKTNMHRWRFFSRDAPVDNLSDILSSMDDCNLSLSGYVHKQSGGTCYANAVATAVRATEKRIVGRNPMPHADIVREIVMRHGLEGAHTFSVLQEECKKRRLGCQEVNLHNLVEVLQSNRTAVVDFRLTEDVWHAFSTFFKNNPTGILTKHEIERFRPDPDLPSRYQGHAVCACGLLKEGNVAYLSLKNSWGKAFADRGIFKVSLDVIFDPQFGFQVFDVFFRICDLSNEDLRNFELEQERMRESKQKMEILSYIS